MTYSAKLSVKVLDPEPDPVKISVSDRIRTQTLLKSGTVKHKTGTGILMKPGLLIRYSLCFLL
jgi:hypothetical protein